MNTNRSQLTLALLCSLFLAAEFPRLCQAQNARFRPQNGRLQAPNGFPDGDIEHEVQLMQDALDREAKKAETALNGWLIFVCVGTALAGLGFCGWCYVRSRTSTDPLDHAVNDPWMREYLSKLSPEERGQILAQLKASPENVARIEAEITGRSPELSGLPSESDPEAIKASGTAKQTQREWLDDAFAWPKK